jgi:hypothetical protein
VAGAGARQFVQCHGAGSVEFLDGGRRGIGPVRMWHGEGWHGPCAAASPELSVVSHDEPDLWPHQPAHAEPVRVEICFVFVVFWFFGFFALVIDLLTDQVTPQVTPLA